MNRGYNSWKSVTSLLAVSGRFPTERLRGLAVSGCFVRSIYMRLSADARGVSKVSVAVVVRHCLSFNELVLI